MVYYSFDFVSKITDLCMNEIKIRGLREPKLFCKSIPNSALFSKVFDKLECSKEDILQTDIHTVATLMQDVLWCSNERILSKRLWREINYETSTLSNLSNFIDSRSERFLINILDFLVELLHKKQYNQLGAYKLGDALGKVVLGTADCDPILSEKAGHFLTRMIIEHAKIKHRQRIHTQHHLSHTLYRIDSGYSESHSCHTFYSECCPLDKAACTLARSKHYNRAMARIQGAHRDWLEKADGIQQMMDADDASQADASLENAWISIFTDFELLVRLQEDMNSASPMLYRILWEASKPSAPYVADPFRRSYLFNSSKAFWAERQLKIAFDDFDQFREHTEKRMEIYDARSRTPLKKLNHSIAHIKDNFRKNLFKSDMDEEATMIGEPIRETAAHKPMNMKKAMKNMIKIKHSHGQNKERYLSNVRV